MNTKSIIKLLIITFYAISISAQPKNRLISLGEDGKIVYTPYTEKGDILPDFSHCGYMGGGVAIPNVEVVATLQFPSGGDDFPAIQFLIDSVSKLLPDQQGFRGAVLLKSGTYKISSTIKFKKSGVILRGEGNDKNHGTVLLATSARKYNLIELGTDAKPLYNKDGAKKITDDYVPSGSNILHVQDANKYFKKGDAVMVHRPSTAKWINDIGMDSIPLRPLKGETAYDSFLRFRKFGKNTNQNGTVQWKEGSKDLYFERTITSVSGNIITLDIPITNALQKEYGAATIIRYTFPERITQCGIEHIFGMSVYNPNIKEQDRSIGKYFSDEAHANNFVVCKAIENAWIKNVSVEHFDCCVSTAKFSRFITGQDLSATNPISIITGGRRYAYSVSGQMCLFQRCYASHHRHVFVLGASVAGPNAFVDGRGKMTFASSEPHQRWATGCLYDNIELSGPDASLLAVNRSFYGSGHGWSGSQIVFWNCSAPVIMAMQPPTGQNFIIGSKGVIKDEWSDVARKRTIDAINGVSRSNFKYQGVAAVGDAWIESPNQSMAPKSLYYQQLKDRLGVNALKQVISKEQCDSFSTQLNQDKLCKVDYDQKMAWWRDAKLGMFIHWGVYSIYGGVYKGFQQKNGGAEWIMNRCKIPVTEYIETAKSFNPVNYDAEAWVRLAKDAGMKYIVITTKHHDGFAMFQSKASQFNIADWTIYKKDILDDLAKACRKYDIKLGFYYSQAQDWNNPGGSVARKLIREGWPDPDSTRVDAYTAEHLGTWDPIQQTATMEEYMEKVCIPQVKELLTNYGDVSVLWWDTPTRMTDEFAAKIDALLAEYPMIITNDRLKRPNYPGDYKTPEGRVPKAEDVDGVDWETCMNIGSSWGFKSWENSWKSSEMLIRNLIMIAARGGNYLLNVGPDATGLIPQEAVSRLKEIGKWMNVNGEAIYGVQRSSFKPAWGESTRKDLEKNSVLYLCVFDWPKDGKLLLNGSFNAKNATLLYNNLKLKITKTNDGMAVHVPLLAPDTIATVIKLELNEKLPPIKIISNSQKVFEIVDEH